MAISDPGVVNYLMSHLVPHSFGLVLHRSKELRKLLQLVSCLYIIVCMKSFVNFSFLPNIFLVHIMVYRFLWLCRLVALCPFP